MTGAGTRWKEAELQVVRDVYAAGGIRACRERLPGRSDKAIYGAAHVLGLRSNRMPRVRKSWASSDYIDGEIRRAYERPPTSDRVKRLAKRLERPRWWISKRAVVLGLTRPKKEPDWSEEEMKVLETTAHQSPDAVSRRLRKLGFERTPTSVAVKRKRMHLKPIDAGFYTTQQVAEGLGVERTTVLRWIDQELLRAVKKGGGHSPVSGPAWRVNWRALRAFIVENPALVDLRKVDQVWFIDLLVGRG